MSKIDPKIDESMFLGYSLNSRTYKVFNKRSKEIRESINMIVDDQGFTSIELRKDDVETEGPLCAPCYNASVNDTTPSSRPNPAT